MSKLLNFFQPPHFEDEDKTRRAQLLNALILAVFVALPVLVVGNVLSSSPSLFVYSTSILGLLSALGIRIWMYQGRVDLASIVWLGLALGFVTVGMIALGTVRATNTYIFLVCIVAAGFLLDGRAVVLTTIYSLGAILLIGWGQKAGYLPAGAEELEMSVSHALNFLALLLGTAVLMVFSVRVTDQMLIKAHQEVQERRKSEQTLRQRDAIMQAATLAARCFLQASDWRTQIERVLEELGRATNSSHVFIFENHILEDGTAVTSQRYEWVAPGMKADLHNPLYQNMKLYTPEIVAWYEAMCAGEAFYGTRDVLSQKELMIYMEEGLLSFINVPIFVRGQWWGIIGFDDYVTPRKWSLVEVDAVKIAASTLGVAIERQLNLEALHRRDAILQAVNFAAQRFLQSEAWRKEIPAVLAQLGQATQASHVYIFERHTLPDGTPALSQRYEWVAEGVKAEIDDPDFQDIEIFNKHADPWYENLARGEVHQASLLNLPPGEKEHFRKHGFKTLVDAPIMVENEWWGVIGFDDCFTVRTWSVAEIEAIKIASSTLAAAIQQEKKNEALNRRDAILQAATLAAHSFLQSSDWRGVIDLVLEALGRASSSSHVFIFENSQTPENERVTSLRFEWTAPGIPSDKENPLFQNVPTDADQEWSLAMSSGKVYYATLDTLPPAEAEIFKKQGLRSLINVPIFVGETWWGNIGFDHYLQMHQWSSAEIDALQITASTLGAAIQRQLTDERLRMSESRYRTELEARVQERTQQLEEAMREIENVSYTASHDLRAPVRAINGYAHLLLREATERLSKVEHHYLQKIEQESHRMGNLLDDLIRLIHLNRQTLYITQINLSAIAQKAANELQKRFPQKSVHVEIQPELYVQGDLEMLQVVLNELLDNAWKFTALQTHPEVRFGVLQKENRWFYVQDNGIGFEMAYAHKLFRNFEQLHLPGTYPGTGMGLAIVQRIIQRHGGKVWAEGIPEMGATIYFTLPE
ncbi:MAG: hypothetical protein Fur0022_49150 [Anaerolineales bacterium]